MISFLSGIIESKSDNTVVVSVSGVGFCVYMPQSSISLLPETGSEVKVYTYLYIREDIMSLYGFTDERQREIFMKLIGVSGIGPKGALGILSVLGTDELCEAIRLEDVDAITKAPGIGRKIASKLVIELKDKVDYGFFANDDTDRLNTLFQNDSSTDNKRHEVIQALTSLGYSSHDALIAVSKVLNIEESDTTEDILKKALRYL